jgi:hypothetical protein
MFVTLRRPLAFGLALSASVSASLFTSPHAARALNVVVDGYTYDLQLFTGSYSSNPTIFQSTTTGGQMPWWGNPTLADALAGQLANGLSPTYTPGDPVEGPLFATSFAGSSPGAEITASFFDLSTLGITDVVTSGSFDGSVSLTYAVSSAPVPAPLPLLGLACGFAATRRLRRRVLQNQGQHRAP